MAADTWPSRAECLASIRGETVPIDLRHPLARACLVRGIRLHLDFAMSDSVIEICKADAQFARARNARLIMSNVVPVDIDQDEEPYCIWYPDIASEETYRSLVQRHPRMLYQVARACAAAGYNALYHELELLPDVSIAEEARESGTEGGLLIYKSIMRQPFRYSVMDDYSLTINTKDAPCPAFLNGHTEVRWRLDSRTGAHPNAPVSIYSTPNEPCIEEDMHIDDDYKPLASERVHLSADESRLLYEPLPADLPTVKTTLLTEMAAFEGSIDRYSRLARPASTMAWSELLCVVRGIYHHTMFARWWLAEIGRNTRRAQAAANSGCGFSYLEKIKEAISARRIMVNDASVLDEDGWPAGTPQPYLIWWPLRPDHDMLRLLAKTVPKMAEQVAVAAIYCDYEHLYRSLQPTPDWHLWAMAKMSGNPFYLQDLEKRAAEKSLDITYGNSMDPDAYCIALDFEPTSLYLPGEPLFDGIPRRTGPYDQGSGPDSSEIDFMIWNGPG